MRMQTLIAELEHNPLFDSLMRNMLDVRGPSAIIVGIFLAGSGEPLAGAFGVPLAISGIEWLREDGNNQNPEALHPHNS